MQDTYNSLEVKQKKEILAKYVDILCPDFVVKNGIFKGMKCPQMKSTGNIFFPQLLGSYEREIQPILEDICQKKYTEIVDIGCAEGYYAVGLARRIPTATVYAYDTNQAAIVLCQEAAKLNSVEARIITGSFCDAETLKAIPWTEKGLVFCDCEGYEKELFNQSVADTLVKHDLLIEIHDGVDIYISSHIQEVFKNTHNIKAIPVLTDIQRAKTYNYPEIEKYDLETKRILVAENRLNSTEWLYIEAKS